MLSTVLRDLCTVGLMVGRKEGRKEKAGAAACGGVALYKVTSNLHKHCYYTSIISIIITIYLYIINIVITFMKSVCRWSTNGACKNLLQSNL